MAIADQTTRVLSVPELAPYFWRAWFDEFARRYPFGALFFAIIASNLAGSFFNFFYNTLLIVDPLTQEQRAAFWNIAGPWYNVVAYPFGLVVYLFLIWPMYRCLATLRRGEPVDPAYLQYSQRRLINFPIAQLVVNLIAVLPGAIFFPWIITAYGGESDVLEWIWLKFIVSFVIHAIFITVQTFFIVQAFLTAYLYPVFFKDTRPETVPGIWTIPFPMRLTMMWGAVALAPMIAVLAVALSFPDKPDKYFSYTMFALTLVLVSAISGGGIFWLVGRDLRRWVQLQTQATGQIAEGNFDIRIDNPRPDEWGRLTNRFNDMATSLNQAWESHETLGQLVSPEVRDQILRRSHGLEVEIQEITVLFVDIRGFTPRCAGQSPAKVGELLNRFLTLALRSIEENGGYVNKFLGDGVMALYGATHPQPNHADLALASSRDLVERLKGLNAELAAQGQAPLVIGIGIHTGEALVGCFGAILHGADGKLQMRREFSAIGETVNLGQRMEQLTKKCGGPILLSEKTYQRLQAEWPLEHLGPQTVPGAAAPIVVYKMAG